MDCKKSGVDIEKGDAFVEWIKETQPLKQPHQNKKLKMNLFVKDHIETIETVESVVANCHFKKQA